ncbi:MAG: pimeloyl-ACP methyl ester esterase BioH [Gammaproteobacteria bacterium]|jgi:pimeloyl-[acyl-carrier protein] methyl ester esterase
MSLYTETSGTGPDLVLVHGWGLHGGVWDKLVPLLEPVLRVTCVDLPGHGRSVWGNQRGLDDLAAAVLSAVPKRAAWLGWSLGSLVAAQAALGAPQRIDRLVLLAGTPCFVRRPDWSPGLLPAVLDTFAGELQRDYRRSLNRFLSLQVRGSEDATGVLRELRTRLLAHGRPEPEALHAGLDILRHTDLRDCYPRIGQPTLLLMGARDTLVPPAAGERAARLLADAQVTTIEGVGHAPFIARPREVAAVIRAFLGTAAPSATGEAHAR